MPARINRATTVIALALAACAALVGARRVAVDFAPVRERVIKAPVRPDATGDPVVRIVPATSRPLSVIVAQVVGGEQQTPVDVRLDGRTLARVNIEPHRRRRIDVQVPGGLSAGSRLAFMSTTSGWSLAYLELANQHGFSSGLFNAAILPASRHDYQSIPWWLIVPGFGVLAVSWTRPSQGRWPRTEVAFASIGVLVWLVALVAPLVSAYAIVLSLPTYLLTLVLAFGACIRRHYVHLRNLFERSRPHPAHGVDAALVVLAIGLFFATALQYGLRAGGDEYAGFLHFSDRFASAPVLDEHPQLRASLQPRPTGYDGQFMFLIAFDPWLTRYEPARYSEITDAPPYRYGRIGFSVLTRLFSGGNAAAFGRTMMWLIVLGNVVAGVFLVLIARDNGASAWSVLPYVLIPAFMVSLANALPESIAAALLIGGLWAEQRAHRAPRTSLAWYWAAIALWSASLLVRETGALLILCVVVWRFFEQAGSHAVVPLRDGTARNVAGRRLGAAGLLLAFVPIAAWRAYVGVRLAPAFGWRAWSSDASVLTWPFAGFVQLWSVNDGAHGNTLANTMFPILLVALLALAVALAWARRNPAAIAAVGYAAVAVSLDYAHVWSWLGNAERTTYELFILVLVAAQPLRTLSRPVRSAVVLFAVLLLVYDLQVGTYAAWFRSAILLFR